MYKIQSLSHSLREWHCPCSSDISQWNIHQRGQPRPHPRAPGPSLCGQRERLDVIFTPPWGFGLAGVAKIDNNSTARGVQWTQLSRFRTDHLGVVQCNYITGDISHLTKNEPNSNKLWTIFQIRWYELSRFVIFHIFRANRCMWKTPIFMWNAFLINLVPKKFIESCVK